MKNELVKPHFMEERDPHHTVSFFNPSKVRKHTTFGKSRHPFGKLGFGVLNPRHLVVSLLLNPRHLVVALQNSTPLTWLSFSSFLSKQTSFYLDGSNSHKKAFFAFPRSLRAHLEDLFRRQLLGNLKAKLLDAFGDG